LPWSGRLRKLSKQSPWLVFSGLLTELRAEGKHDGAGRSGAVPYGGGRLLARVGCEQLGWEAVGWIGGIEGRA
jgi:hypothetical protein